MEALARKRNANRPKLTRIQTAVNKHGTTALDQAEVTVLLDNLAEIKTKVTAIQEAIEDACTDDQSAKDQADAYAWYDDMICDLRVELLRIQATLQPAPAKDPSSPQSNSSNVKLPRIEIPEFTGKYEDWAPFEDLFLATYGNNRRLQDSEKLQYLKSYVKGEAAGLIKSYQITNDNYAEAWAQLKNRYSNEREIVNSILKRLFNQAVMKQESASTLRKLTDTTDECVRALAVLKRPVDTWDDLLVFIVVERLDADSRSEWAMSLKGTTCPTYQELSEFLDQRVRGLQAAGTSQGKGNTTSSGYGNGDRRQASSHHGAPESCIVCHKDHPIYHCQKFKSMSATERYNAVKSSSLCFKCLKSGHGSRDCPTKIQCKKCREPHNVLLHFERKSNPSESTTTSLFSGNSEGESTEVLLATAIVNITDQGGVERQCRVLLDKGSQASFITESCVKSLGLKRRHCEVEISGISATSVAQARGFVSLVISSTKASQEVHIPVEVEALVLPRVTGTLPRMQCDPSSWDHISGLQLADPNFCEPGNIDILLGADIVALVMTDGRRTGRRNTPVAENTVFGWVLYGGRASAVKPQVIRTHVGTCDTDSILRRFWELEELPKVKHYTAEEKSCEKHFMETHTRDSTGRYVVKFPFKDNVAPLGLSRDQAVSRLKQVERRLAKAPEYKKEYAGFMKEYLDLNHMIPASSSQESSSTYYLPHHFVLKEESSSTKFRVVFDGSAKSTSGISLNQKLMVGPTIQDDLFSLLVRFRFNVVALKADIRKMYRQFEVCEEEQDLQRIVWRESPEQPIRDYKLRTLTYGTAPASFLSTRCVQQLAEDEKEDFPLASKILKSDLYVDDLMSGESTTERAKERCQELCELVKRGGMSLLKWSTSDPEVLKSIPEELREKEKSISLDLDTSIKALGVKWNPGTDSFVFTVVIPEVPPKLTKRTVLSQLAKVFDPLGWLSPVTVTAKIIFQDLWRLDIGWDEELPSDVKLEWERYLKDISCLKNISIPRCVILPQAISIQFHGFSDASAKAYSAAVYVRCQSSDSTVVVNLLTAKTKVAPIKTISVPKLELCGAVMLVQLLASVQEASKIKCQVFGWTDSTIVLDWLADTPDRWMTFVANRVAEIQEFLPVEDWRHVVSEENPADCASRGIPASELAGFSLWWHGPPWLKTYSEFPVYVRPKGNQNLEAKAKVIVVSHVCLDPLLISKFVSLSILKRITAYCLRFVNNCLSSKKKREKKTGPITCEELDGAQEHWILHVQNSEFGPEVKALSSGKQIPATSKLRQLSPYLDCRGVLRVGGRLQKLDAPEGRKHPILLPHNHQLTILIIRHLHLKTMHGGFQVLWATLQMEFWILRARDTIRNLIRRCVTCRKQRAQTAQQLMGSLPRARVNPGRPFLHCGVDYAGPFNLRLIAKGRGNKTHKSYFAIFVCFSTKAVHLEVVSELSTEAFLACFKRFTSRRGVSSHMYSDCGTNFVGADRELRELLESSKHNSVITDQLADKGTTWCFNPPSAPHQGGLWEAGVKSVKYHLRRVIGNHILSLEDFQTVLCQVEAILNSRPLCAMSSDPSDLNVLTPAHFLIGEPLTAIPEPDLTSIKVNRLSHWQQSQQIVQHYWKRWRAEVVPTMQQRFKWVMKRENLEVGDLVTIQDDNLPPMKWKMGRVIDVHPGDDSLVRDVTLKTQSGEMERSVVKLAPILYNSEEVL